MPTVVHFENNERIEIDVLKDQGLSTLIALIEEKAFAKLIHNHPHDISSVFFTICCDGVVTVLDCDNEVLGYVVL